MYNIIIVLYFIIFIYSYIYYCIYILIYIAQRKTDQHVQRELHGVCI